MEPECSTSEALVEGLLDMIQTGRFIPAQIRVESEENQIHLKGLTERLGSEIVVDQKVRMLEEARKGFFQHMGIRTLE
jgi:hypothetical protein